MDIIRNERGCLILLGEWGKRQEERLKGKREGSDFEKGGEDVFERKIKERREKGEVLMRIVKKKGRMRGKEEV